MAQLVGLAEVARFLGIESRSPKREGNRLWELIRSGKFDIPCYRVGRLYRFDLAQVEGWLRRNATKVQALRQRAA